MRQFFPNIIISLNVRNGQNKEHSEQIKIRIAQNEHISLLKPLLNARIMKL